MEEDAGEVLGNLPRSRPGKRSEKRASSQKGPAAAAKRAAQGAEQRGGAAARPGRGAPKRGPAPPPEPGEPAALDPVRDAAKLAVRTAGAGLKIAETVSRELLRRIPRP
jgi:hypothetical protein